MLNHRIIYFAPSVEDKACLERGVVNLIGEYSEDAIAHARSPVILWSGFKYSDEFEVMLTGWRCRFRRSLQPCFETRPQVVGRNMYVDG